MRPYLAILATIVLWSTVEVVTKLVGRVDPAWLAFLRFFPPGVVILLIGWREFRRVTARDLLALTALGAVGVTATFAAYHRSLLTSLDASTGAVIFSINPIFAAVTAWLFLGERLTPLRTAGILLGLVGVYIVSFGFRLAEFSSATGPVLMFAAQVCFGVYVALGKKYTLRYGPFFVNGVIFVTGSILCLPLVQDWTVPTANHAVWWIVYLTVAATGVGYTLYFYGLSRVPVLAGSSVFYLKPVLAPLLAVEALSETLRFNFYIGLALILASLGLTIFGRWTTKGG